MPRHLWLVFSVACVAALIIISCSGDGSPTQPNKKLPNITSFTATPSDIVPGDSVTLSYTVTDATQTKLYPGGQILANATSGSIKVGPQLPTLYALVATNADGKDSAAVSVTMSTIVPSITQFDLTVDTILIGDSTQLTWQALRADSIVVNNGVGKLSNATGGTSGHLKPTANISYRAIAYNQYGRDTAVIAARVEVPATVDAPDGVISKGTMGSSVNTPALKFTVRDAQSQLLKKPWVHFSLVLGDGQLSVDSAQPDAGGFARVDYNFSGTLGYALVRAIVTGVDSVGVTIRADAFVPGGTYPQGQYLVVGDLFSTVKAYNGNPVKIDPDPRPTYPLNYADYEATQHIVAVIYDANDNNFAEDNELVYSIILDSLYTRKTTDSIGIGSTIAEVQAVYGVVAGILDPTPPAAYHYDYTAEGLTFWTDLSADRKVFEIHITDVSATLGPAAGKSVSSVGPSLLRRQTGQ